MKRVGRLKYRATYVELVIIFAAFLLLVTAATNFYRPLNQAFVRGCETLQKNYSCNPVETFSIVVPDYRIEDGSFAHLVDVCARLGASGQNECAKLCGC